MNWIFENKYARNKFFLRAQKLICAKISTFEVLDIFHFLYLQPLSVGHWTHQWTETYNLKTVIKIKLNNFEMYVNINVIKGMNWTSALHLMLTAMNSVNGISEENMKLDASVSRSWSIFDHSLGPVTTISRVEFPWLIRKKEVFRNIFERE